MKYNMCHDVDTEKYNSLNAWVPMNPSGASAMNGAMRVIPIDYDDFQPQDRWRLPSDVTG